MIKLQKHVNSDHEESPVEVGRDYSALLMDLKEKLLCHFHNFHDSKGVIGRSFAKCDSYDRVKKLGIRYKTLDCLNEGVGVELDRTCLHFLEESLENYVVPWNVFPRDCLLDVEYLTDVSDPLLYNFKEDLASATDSLCPLLLVTIFPRDLFYDFEVFKGNVRIDMIITELLPVKESMHFVFSLMNFC